MAGFLDQYGAGDEKRERTRKLLILSAIGLLILSGLLYFFFRNYRQEQQAKRFFQALTAHDYQAAYDLWAPTESAKRDYSRESFLRDWGPPTTDVRTFQILDAESCGNNVIVDTDLGAAGERKLWVNRETLRLTFPPYDQCVQQNRIYSLYRNMKYSLHGRTYK